MSTPTEDTGRESTYERGLRHGQSSSNAGGGGGAAWLQRPVGPLPLWVWLALALFGAVGYYLWSKKNASNKKTAASDNTSTGTSTTDSNLIPQFVNQVYTGDTPPELSSPKTGVNYGEAGPPQNGYSAITADQAKTLLSNKNKYNPSGHKSQRPFIWNGSAYVPATVLNPSFQYYAGPVEQQEITKSGSAPKVLPKLGGSGGPVIREG